MRVPTTAELRELTAAERLELLEAVWDSLAAEPESLPLSGEHRGRSGTCPTSADQCLTMPPWRRSPTCEQFFSTGYLLRVFTTTGVP